MKLRVFSLAAFVTVAGCLLLNSPDDLGKGGPLVDGGGARVDGDVVDGGGDEAATRLASTHGCDASFCASFDEPDAYLNEWESPTFTNGGSLSPDGGTPASPPGLLLASTPKSSATTFPGAFVAANVDAGGSHFVFEFKVRLDKRETTDDCSIAAISSGENGPKLRISLQPKINFFEQISDGGGGDTFQPHGTSADLDAGAWTRIVVDIDTTSGRLDATVGDQAVLSNASLSTAWTAGVPRIQIGLLFCTGSTKGWTAAYDDVFVTVD